MEQHDDLVAKNYQSRVSRMSRFNRYSTEKMFYIDSPDGGKLIPNEICAHKKVSGKDFYFCAKRFGFSDVQTASICISENEFSISKKTGSIYDLYLYIFEGVFCCEFYDLQHFQDNLKNVITNHYKHFKLFTQ